jgi:uncharacterized protein YbbC (DUF1343 family)
MHREVQRFGNPRGSIAVIALWLTTFATAGAQTHAHGTEVTPGIERFLADVPAAVRGKRIGLITNHTGVDAAGNSIIDRLRASPHVTLVALYSPEHGIRGTAADGVKIASSTDARTGLPIHSLYGATRTPTASMLANVDALLFDMQDVGVRAYTYISTMALAMRAAKKKGIPFVVLDRPNPIGGHIVEGAILDTAFASFTGIYPITLRHGMTIGELARMFNDRFGIGVDLIVMPLGGWRRGMWFDETGLPWIRPSPNIRRLETAIHYPGTVFVEATNLSEGRGSDLPLEQAGAPWLDAAAMADSMNAMQLPGVRFERTQFTPARSAAKYPGRRVNAVRFVVTNREAYRPVATALRFIDLVRRTHPTRFRWTERGAGFDRLAGTSRLRRAIEGNTLADVLAEWDREARDFAITRGKYLLY